MITVPMTVAVSQVTLPMNAGVSSVQIPVSVSTKYVAVEGETYDGPYSFTPSQETQTAQTANKVLTGDIVIDPIPPNYGLITWNGSYITVS